MQVQFDPKKILGEINELTKIQIPLAATKAVNKALFETKARLRDEAKTVFRDPVAFTLNSFLYEKASPEGDDLKARAFIRDQASGGNAPSDYLNPQVKGRGGRTFMTRFQQRLLQIPVMTIDGRTVQAREPGTRMRPSNSNFVRRTRKGNMTPGQYGQILSALKGGVSSADLMGGNNNGMYSPANQSYTYLDELALDDPYFRNRFKSYRQPGIYKIERVPNPNNEGKMQLRYYKVLGQVPRQEGLRRFDFFGIANDTITSVFVREFKDNILR